MDGSSLSMQPSQETIMEDLSEDIMLDIASRLNLRDVVNLSLLRKHWSHLPCCIREIVIDTHLFGKGCQQNNDSFIKGVNQYLDHYFKLCRNIPLWPIHLDRLDILFCFPRRNFSDIDSWIIMAICDGVRILNVRPRCTHHAGTLAPDDDKYIFPWAKVHNFPVMLKSLSLRACIFGCRLNSKWIFLELLDLYDSNLTEYDMDRISFCFPNLKHLRLNACKVPAKITFSNDALTFLKVWFCPGLEEIDLLGAEALKWFNYRGNRIDLDRVSSPKLTVLQIGFLDVKGDDYVLQHLHVNTLKSLSVFRESERMPSHSLHLYGQMSSCLWLHELKLYSHPSNGINRQTLIGILRACPVLTRLEMVPPCSIDYSESDFGSDYVQYLHKCLRFIKVSGFCGSWCNVEMVKFLVQVPEKLHHAVVQCKIENDDYKYFKHSADWHGEEEPEAVKDMLLRLIKSEQLTFICTQKLGRVNKCRKLLKTCCLWCD